MGVIGLYNFITGFMVVTEVINYNSPGTGWGRTTSTGRKEFKITLGFILLVLSLNIYFELFAYDIAGYSINALILGVIGLLMIIFSLGRKRSVSLY